jgi:Type I restriction enzyme R protein N terminus (HSDR_N)
LTTRTEAASEVRKVLQSVKDRLAQPGGAKVNEATTRAHFISPLLGALGYRSIEDILFEVYLPDGKTFLDYRLVVGGKPLVSVEAKALEVNLAEKDAAQAVQYASLLGDPWAVVTNAREWRLYETFAQVPLADKHILTVNLVSWDTDAQFESVFDQLWLISQEAFEGSGGPATWLTSKKLDRLLRVALTDPTSPEVKYIRKRLQDQDVSVTPEQVAAWIQARLESPSSTGVRPNTPTPTPASVSVSLAPKPSPAQPTRPSKPSGGEPSYWIIPAGAREGISAAEYLHMWLPRGYWGFRKRTPGRRVIRDGDYLCFYASKDGQILAFAEVSGTLDQLVSESEWPEPNPRTEPVYKVPIVNLIWLEEPVTLDAGLRNRLDVFADKGPNPPWSWLVQTTHRITPADFKRLTGQ